jgi:hypothetical protein
MAHGAPGSEFRTPRARARPSEGERSSNFANPMISLLSFRES